MLNSLIVFCAALAFVAFGYFSLIRILWKEQTGESPGLVMQHMGHSVDQMIHDLGRSAIFVSLPATSLLLFWGWGPAVLWLVMSHLLIETTFNLQFAVHGGQTSLVERLFEIKDPARSLIWILWQLLFVFLCAILISIMTTFVDQQAGLFWALLALLPAQALLRHPHPLIPTTLKTAGAAAVFVLGLLLADKLGIAVYGNWFPFGNYLKEYIGWLSLNNNTMVALVLTLAAFALSRRNQFCTDLATLSGLLLIGLMAVLIGALIWMRPLFDAPLNSAQVRADALPWFIGVCLVISGGLLAQFLRLLDHASGREMETQFGGLQFSSAMHFMFSLLLIIALASALGIGSWKTHYIDWSGDINLMQHFELAVIGLFDLASNRSDLGIMIHTLFMSGISFIAASLLLALVQHLRADPDELEEAESFLDLISSSRVLQGAIIFLLSCYFISAGVPVNMWLIVGMLVWMLVTQVSISLTIELGEESFGRGAYGALCLVLVGFGALQTIAITVGWALQQEYFYVAAAIIFLALATYFWLRPVRKIAMRFKKVKDQALFE